MSVIRYSGNADNPDSFSQRDFDHLIKTHNETIDAIKYILNYTERSSKTYIEKALEARDLEDLAYYTDRPQNKLISALGFANATFAQDGYGPYDSFSPFLSLKIRNEISDYERTYSELTQRVSNLHWAFQLDMIFAFDKLWSGVKKFKSKYKNIIGLHEIIEDLETHINKTANLIGKPEIDWFNGSLDIYQALDVRKKLDLANTPIFPLHMYHDILRFEAAQDKVNAVKRERSRSLHYANARQNSNVMSDKNIELSQSNMELSKRIQQLEQDNAKLAAQNARLSTTNNEMLQQIAAMRRGLFGKISAKLSQRKK